MKSKQIIKYGLIFSLIAEAFLIYIIYLNPNKMTPLYPASIQMGVNAILNACSALCLFLAIHSIKKKRVLMHKRFINGAMVFSSLFLVNYIFYHMSVGHVKFTNPDFRIIYLLILITHLIASIVSLPLILITYSLGFFSEFSAHKKIAIKTFILWEYVSITGVIIVLMLKFLNS